MAGKRSGGVWDGKKVKCRHCGLTRADRPGDVRGVARLAGAGVGTQRVDALTVLAQISHHTTLVNVWRETRERYGQINGPSGTNRVCQKITEQQL